MTYLLIVFVAPLLSLAVGYTIGVQYERGGAWIVLAPVALVAAVIDVIVNYTILAILMAEFPRYGEWTFSNRLERLVFDGTWRGSVARFVATALNHIAPNKRHIKNWHHPTLPS